MRQSFGAGIGVRFSTPGSCRRLRQVRLRLQPLCRLQRHLQRAQLCSCNNATGACSSQQSGRCVERKVRMWQRNCCSEHGIVQRSLALKSGSSRLPQSGRNWRHVQLAFECVELRRTGERR